MLTKSLGLGCMLLLLAAQASHGQAAPTDRTLGDVWLEGTIGAAAVRVYIADAGWPKESGIRGIYYYTRYWTPLPLDGDWVDDQHIRLIEGDADNNYPQPRVDLTLSNSTAVTGTWTSAKGDRTVPVRLRRVPQPPSFATAIKQKVRFDDPRWPISLDYPRGWRFEASEGRLLLRSPDPKDMLYENELSCEQGSGVPDAPGPEEPDEPFISPFYWTRDGWRVGTSLVEGCDADNCEKPKTRPEKYGRFMRAEAGYRSSSPWGYGGLGSMEVYLVVIGDRWVACQDRLLDSHQRIRLRAPVSSTIR